MVVDGVWLLEQYSSSPVPSFSVPAGLGCGWPVSHLLTILDIEMLRNCQLNVIQCERELSSSHITGHFLHYAENLFGEIELEEHYVLRPPFELSI